MRPSLLPALLLFATAIVTCAQTAHTRAYLPYAGESNPARQYENHLKDCRIAADVPGAPIKFRHDKSACTVDRHAFSEHWVQHNLEGKIKWMDKRHEETNLLLRNNSSQPIAYLVQQAIPKGWRFDSDTPQPVAVTGKTATFRVVVAPNQAGPLHMGEVIYTPNMVPSV